jgi:hypothetical protein
VTYARAEPILAYVEDVNMRVGTAAFIALSIVARSEAQSLPSISAEEKALRAVASEPDAVAVVLQKRAIFHMRDIKAQEPSSKLTVMMRTKILKEAGRSFGEIEIAHSSSVRLAGFEGRVVTPSGQEIKVDKSAKFQRKVSERLKRAVTAVAFPSVEVGSILDYKYELFFDSLYFSDALMFSERIPVLAAEFRFEVPFQIGYRGWSRQPPDAIQVETKKAAKFSQITARVLNLPAVPAEPFAPSLEDLGVQMFLFPEFYRDPDVHFPIMESWPAVAESLEKDYLAARKKSVLVEQKGRDLVADVTDAEERLGRIFRYVRDEIETVDDTGPWPSVSTLDDLLSTKKGNSADKVLLLQAMFKAAGIESKIVWASDRRERVVDPEIPNPAWYPRTIALVERPTGLLYLDVSDSTLAQGRLAPGFEGAAATVHDPKAPRQVVLPSASFAANGRKLTLDLRVDAEGRTTGTGTLVHRGHSAWQRIALGRDAEETLRHWTDLLGERLPGFDASDVKVVEKVDEALVEVKFSVAARTESVLGDEVSLQLSRPLGPAVQPFPGDPQQRKTPVRLDFGSQDDVVANVSWAEGWSVSSMPPTVAKPGTPGFFSASTKADLAARTLRFERTLQIRSREPKSPSEFVALHGLYAEAEKADAQALLLVRR